MNVVQHTSDITSDVLDGVTDVSDAVSTTIAKSVSWVPVLGPIAVQAADEFNFQVNNVVNLIDDQQATAGDLLDLGQYIVGDLLDPSVDNVEAALEQGGVYINDTFIDAPIATLVNGVESIFDFG